MNIIHGTHYKATSDLFGSHVIGSERIVKVSNEFVDVFVENHINKNLVSSLSGMVAIPKYIFGLIRTSLRKKPITQYWHLHHPCPTTSSVSYVKPCWRRKREVIIPYLTFRKNIKKVNNKLLIYGFIWNFSHYLFDLWINIL